MSDIYVNLKLKTIDPLESDHNYLVSEQELREYCEGDIKTFITQLIADDGICTLFDYFDFTIGDCKIE